MTTKQKRDIKVGGLIFKADCRDVVCPLHPKYTLQKEPKTEKTTDDGCLCWVAWGMVGQKPVETQEED